jgi:hypothetical protein
MIPGLYSHMHGGAILAAQAGYVTRRAADEAQVTTTGKVLGLSPVYFVPTPTGGPCS